MFNKTEQDIMNDWQGDLSNPIISICSITYNHEKYIEQAIDSFLIQKTNFSFEIVIGEDCSTDDTRSIIEKYIAKYPNIIKLVSSNNNVGMNKNFMRTLNTCRGKYIAICEGDDYWSDPNKLQIQKDFLDENNEYVICYGKIDAFNDNGIVKDYIGGATRDLSSEELKKISPINTLTTCFRNVIDSFPFEFTQTKYGDIFLWSLLSKYGKGKYLDSMKPSMYRIHEAGVHSMVSEHEKYDNSLISFSAMFSYYKRINDQETMTYFRKRILDAILRRESLILFTCLLSIKQMLRLVYMSFTKILNRAIFWNKNSK